MKKLDFSTILSFMLCLLLCLYTAASGSKLSYFFSVDALCITLIGSFAAMILTFSFSKSIKSLNYLRLLFSSNSSSNIKLIHDFVEISKGIRKNGIITIENYIDNVSDPLMKKGLTLISLNQPMPKIKKILESAMDEKSLEYENGANFFKRWASYSPAFGMLGTIIGMVQMFNNMSDFALLADGFGKAFLTTLYGLVLANLVFMPVAARILQANALEEEKNEIILEGLTGLVENVNNKILKETLFSYLSKEERKEYSKIQGDLLHLVA